MNLYTINSIREKTKAIFERHGFVEKAYLFGSYARGEATEKSDIDFMVVLNRAVGLEFFGLYDRLEEALDKKVDVLTKEEAERLMKKNLERDQIMLYEREYKDSIPFCKNV